MITISPLCCPPQKLEFLQAGGPSQSSTPQAPPPYLQDLARLFGASDTTNDDIFDWIEVGFVHACTLIAYTKIRHCVTMPLYLQNKSYRLFFFLQKNCAQEDVETPQFIRTLTTAVVQATVSGMYVDCRVKEWKSWLLQTADSCFGYYLPCLQSIIITVSQVHVHFPI